MVPNDALDWIEEVYGKPKKLKWYFEENGKNESYEAKFKLNGLKYSVEFDDDGDIEDIEIQLSWRKLAPKLKAQLTSSFNKIEKFKLDKIQEQWSDKDENALKRAALSKDNSQITIRYEIVFRAQIDGVTGKWEGLFDQNGTLLEKRKIYTRPSDNFDF